MAVLNFSITVPDAEVPRVTAAVKEYFGNPAMTNSEAIEALRQQFITRIKEIVARQERDAAIAAAASASYDVSAT